MSDLALLDFRNTPTQNMETSPAQRLMNRRTKTLMPTSGSLLRPKVVENAAAKIKMNQDRQAHYYNKGAKDLPMLAEEAVVRVAPSGKHKEWIKAEVFKQTAPRSYEVVTETGQALRRDRRRLRKTTEKPLQQTVEEIEISEHTTQTLPSPDSDLPVELPSFQPDEPVPEAAACVPSSELDVFPTGPVRRSEKRRREIKRPGHLRNYV